MSLLGSASTETGTVASASSRPRPNVENTRPGFCKNVGAPTFPTGNDGFEVAA
jgi:hypothetical protein